ncbi:MAG TPA: YceI family protein [Polyangia bacterium]|nr:YceI family protein [Polyangia bacterium]
MPDKERWEIDVSHSRLGFSLRHIVVSEIHGWFGSWGGEMLFDPEYIPRTQIQVWIDVASIDTGSPERDAHLRSAEFLDAARFPRAQFTSTDVALRRDGEAGVTGRLQLHGTARPVDLDVAAQRTWVDDQGLMRAAYDVHARVDRQAFGLHWNQDLDVGGIVVGDKVEIDAHIELVRTAAADLSLRDPTAIDSVGAADAG